METTTVTINKIKSKLVEVPEDRLEEIYDFVEFILEKSKVKSNAQGISSPKSAVRKFGCGKGIFTYVSEDFDDSLPEFEEYMK